MKFIILVMLFASTAFSQAISSEPSSSDCDGQFPLLSTSYSSDGKAGTTYSQSDIDNAATAALYYYANGETIGKDKYPHQYNDYEGFEFECSAPYLEFPIEQGGTYSGGSPGANRVVIGTVSSDDSSAQYCAVITHDGESNNNFAECSDS